MEISEKRKKVEKYILDCIMKIDRYTDKQINIARYKKMFESMSDAQFDTFMHYLKENKTCLYVYLPNVTKRPTLDEAFIIADELGVNLFHRLKLYDPSIKEYYLTNEKYPVLRIPIRRLQQFLDKKLSVPHGDTKTDTMTGQVTWEDKAATLTNPEIQSLNAKGLTKVLEELITIRGGNIDSWSGDMKHQAEETGIVLMDDISQKGHTRTAIVAQLFFESMMLSINIIEE